jgi:hypothetical protein
MSRFGVNPYGDPLFRIVYAPSVKLVVGGEFQDGFTGYRVRPAYRHIGSEWIIEKWISAQESTGQTEAAYNLEWKNPYTGLISTGPYPSRGQYHYCETIKNPGDINAEVLTQLILKAKNNDPLANQRAMQATMEAEEKAADKERFDRCKELLPAFGVRAANLGGHVKATKSAPIMKSANELNLPNTSGGFQVKKGQS